MAQRKLNVLLAVTDHLAGQHKGRLEDYGKYFRAHQGAFKGIRKTYAPRPDTVDDPSMRSTTQVVTTVDEKLAYLEEQSAEYVNALFSQEATNASGKAKAELFVEGKSFGSYSSLELLRLVSLLESGTMKAAYENIPVRSDSVLWEPAKDEAYANRKGIFANDLVKGTKKTTDKESYILTDPNIGKSEKYAPSPQVAQKNITVELGEYTIQEFSGEWSHRQRAELLSRRDKLIGAAKEALKVSNDVEAVESSMTAGKLFEYLHKGKLPSKLG
jgi:hypothetical protein